jgi:tetratricopeptide (TPR) repeat protein
VRLAEAYEAFGKTDLALKEYQEVVKMAPDNPVIQFQYGLSSAKLGKKNQAVQAFREVIRISPDSEEAKLARDHIKLLQ